jgi:hypothetical protein
MPRLLRPLIVSLLSAVLVGVCALPLQAQVPQGKRYALLVGVKDYEDRDLPDLKFTENDIEELAALLARPGAGFTSVRVLTTSRGRRRAADRPTLANIRQALVAVLGRTTKHDTVLVALAGHGLQRRSRGKQECFFCPADGKGTRVATLLGLAEVFRKLEGSKAGVQLLLVDACRNDPKEGRNFDLDILPRPTRGVAALFSCKSGERAFESARLGKGHGVFFHFVLEGLRGRARDDRGAVTWNRLIDYVTEQVTDQAPRLIGGGARQTPQLVANLTGKSPILLRLEKPRPVPPQAGALRRIAWAGVHVYHTAFSPNGSLLLAGGDVGPLRLWRVADGKLLHELKGHTGWVQHARFTPDGKHALSGGTDGTVRLWDVATGRSLRIFRGHRGAVAGVDVSPDGRRALSGGEDGTLRIWEIASGKELRRLTGHAGRCAGVFTPDGTHVVSYGDDRTVRQWQSATGKQLWLARGHTGPVWGVGLLGRHVLSYAADRTGRLWDRANGRLVRTLFLGRDLTDIRSVAVDLRGGRFLSGHTDRTVRLRDLDSGGEIIRFKTDRSPRGLAVSLDGRLAASGSHRGFVYLWRLPPPAGGVARRSR